MTQVESFQIEDIDGCEFVFSRIVGHMLISWDNHPDGYETGKILAVYADGSRGAVEQDEAQGKLDAGEWKVYRP